MKSEVKEILPTQREIHIEIDAESLKQAYGLVSQKYTKQASIPGFRKGYAPLDVVRLRYKDEIKSEVLQQVVPLKVSEAIQEHKLQPLIEPQLHIDNIDEVKVNGTEPIQIHAHIQVMPEIPMPEYAGVEITRRVKPVEDSEIDDLIKHRLEQEAALIPVEGRASEMGDTVITDLEGKFDDDPDGDAITAADLEVKLGDEVIEKAFTENLVGVKQDDEKEFTVAYPSDFSASQLAGKTVHYKAKVKSVGQTEMPEANDEWAKSLDEGYSSIKDLRKKLRSDLETYAKADADARVRNTAVGKLIEANQFEVPNALIENQARSLLNNFARDLQQRGVDLNTVDENFVQMAMQQMRTQAEHDVRGALLLEKIGEAENVKVTSDEVDEEIGKMAEYYRSTAEEVKESLKPQGGERTIENNLRTRKTIEAIVSKATVNDGPWEEEQDDKEPSTEEKPKKAAKKKGPSAKKASSV